MKKLFIAIIFTAFTFAAPVQAAPSCYVDVQVSGLVCDFCARALEKMFSRHEEVATISVDMDAGIVRVVYHEGKTLDEATLRRLIIDSGYAVRDVSGGEC